MTPEYPSRDDVWTLCGVTGRFVDWTGASERRVDDDDDEEELDKEADLSPELLLYTNKKPVTMVTMMMPLTPWH